MSQSQTTSYICIHGHFYQPPRENPWTGHIERQVSAFPDNDWNQRIQRECYAANSHAQVYNEAGSLEEVLNNYSLISFNFGPTLLSWMERADPSSYQRILEADQISQKRFSGHGSAIAQAYNHMIMPLASRRDKITQVRWGLRDFESRFGRASEGLWLPEAAVDVETLEVLVDHGIRYVILAPHQALEQVDPAFSYGMKLPSGGEIAIFYYNSELSQAVAFGGLLFDGKNMGHELVKVATQWKSNPSLPTPSARLCHIATDGESYGHHHKHGEMALAKALRVIEQNPQVQLTNYAEYLSRYGIQRETLVKSPSSWSCAHGIERWRSNCGCTTGTQPSGHQAWRQPLREALELLKSHADRVYEEKVKNRGIDPWTLRNESAQWLLHPRAMLEVEKDLPTLERIQIRKLLELQKNSLFMMTSCAWFFDDLSRIEAQQVLLYADRILNLLAEWNEAAIEERFLQKLSEAQSAYPEMGSGREIFHTRIRSQHRSFVEYVVQAVILKAAGLRANVGSRIEMDIRLLEQSATKDCPVEVYQAHAFRDESFERIELTATLRNLPRGFSLLIEGPEGFRREYDESSLSLENTRRLFAARARDLQRRSQILLRTSEPQFDPAFKILSQIEEFLEKMPENT